MANDSTPKDFDSIGVDDFYVFLNVDPSCSEKDVRRTAPRTQLAAHFFIDHEIVSKESTQMPSGQKSRRQKSR